MALGLRVVGFRVVVRVSKIPSFPGWAGVWGSPAQGRELAFCSACSKLFMGSPLRCTSSMSKFRVPKRPRVLSRNTGLQARLKALRPNDTCRHLLLKALHVR